MSQANRLAKEGSPYLLQHAHNPVDWYPWGEEAFERARREDKPVFLSVGYSTCHWCHVMERESFADAETAGVLNETFVCVKVDREERPDIDRHYMAACQMLTGSGGWPLTVIMTPDKKPFFAGTYFPKSRRFGRAGLLELAPLIGEAWRTRREEVMRAAGNVLAAVERPRPAGSEGAANAPSAAVLDEAFRELAADFDKEHGGFGGAPKFPLPHQVRFLLRYGRRAGRAEAATMAEKTLEAMRGGGLFDQLGFGFHRYSTDAGWLVPHFEKMLYDQALLAEAYAEAFAATGRQAFARTAAEVAEYVLRDMTSPEGGFYTAEDADSEGEEGRFYLWTAEEIRSVLGEEDASTAMEYFGVRPGGNFSEPGRGPDGRNILHLTHSAEEGERNRGGPGTPKALDEGVRRQLFEARAGRTRPFKDTKILTDWNGLMISALAAVFRVMGEERYLRAADRAADIILGRMRDAEGRLMHMYAGGESRVPGLLDDYAFLIKGLIGLYESSYDPGRLESALALTCQAVDLFWDDREGGFFFAAETPDFAAPVKEIYDGAVPSGNSVMLSNLLRQARLGGDAALETRASRLAAAFSSEVGRRPRLYTEFLVGLDSALSPSREVVVAGRRKAPDTRRLLEALRTAGPPNTAVLFKPTDEPRTALVLGRVAAFTKDMGEVDGRAAAFVCSGGRCLRPVTTAKELLELLHLNAIYPS